AGGALSHFIQRGLQARESAGAGGTGVAARARPRALAAAAARAAARRGALAGASARLLGDATRRAGGGVAPMIPAGESEALVVRGTGTELVLTHRDLPAAKLDAHRQGWTDIVAKLAAVWHA